MAPQWQHHNAGALQVTDKGVENLVKSMTSLVTLNIMGCHRLTPRAKGQVARLLDNPFND